MAHAAGFRRIFVQARSRKDGLRRRTRRAMILRSRRHVPYQAEDNFAIIEPYIASWEYGTASPATPSASPCG